MANFPSLTAQPSQREFEEESAYDPTIRTKSEGGYVKTRPRYSRFPKKWTIVYRHMSQTDKNSLQTFEEARGVGGESFDWTNPQDEATYEVRFAAPIVYQLLPMSGDNHWRVEFVVEEV